MADEAQPAEGQDPAGNESNGLYDLSSLDPSVREAVEPVFKEFDGNVTKKFQEAAEYRKGWAPYEDLGVKDMEPAALQQLLQFAQIAGDSEQFDKWLTERATERGILKGDDDLDLDELDLSPEKVQELIDKGVSEKVTPLQEAIQQQEHAKAAAEADEVVGSAFKKIEGEQAELFEGDEEAKEQVRAFITRLASGYLPEDESKVDAEEVLRKGLADYLGLIGKGENSLLATKANPPAVPEGPGAPNTSPEKITSFGDPRLEAAALQKIKAS